jgi:RHS repeat-associated protein
LCHLSRPSPQTATFTRDPISELVTAETDPLGRNFTYGYDANSNLTSITCSNCLSSSVTSSAIYDPTFSQPTSVTDALNHTWTVGYDSRGNPTSITDPLNHQVTLGWNYKGQLTSFADALNDTVHFGYLNGDLTTITDPLNSTIHHYTDGAGRVISILDPLGNLTQFGYDNIDDLTQITDPNSGQTTFTYSNYSGTGRPSCSSDGKLLCAIADAKGNVTSYAYDSRNRMVSRTDALIVSDSYGYDANGNLTGHTDRRGKVTKYQYDGLNRSNFAGYGYNGSSYESTVNYTWDAANRVTKAVDSIAGTITRTYDGLDDLTQEVTPQGTVNYTYDNVWRRATMQVVGQTQVIYTWDNANRLANISQGSASVGLNYDIANRRSCLALPNGVIASYLYDNDSRVTSLTYGTGGSCLSLPPPSNLGNLTYTYDATGRRTATAGSLAAVTLPANVAGGNSTTYNADNAQTKFNGTTLGYDANGNLTGDGTNTYTWDGRDHLTAISGGTTASFVYDGFGRRMKKVIGAATTQFVYDGWNPVQELDGSKHPNITANLLTGLGIDEYFTRTASTTTSTFLPDALGSTIGLVTANNGPIATNYTYQPFGATTIGGSANGNSYEFTGRENDGTGLYFYRARYYSPTYQRFVSQDPLDFEADDPNLYSYVQNQPATFTDPSGMQEVPVPIEPGPVGPPGIDLDPLGPPSPQCAAPRKITYNECLNAAEHPTLWERFCSRWTNPQTYAICMSNLNQSPQMRRGFCDAMWQL